MPRYCVTGGTGCIASHLVKHLLAQGHTVCATVRDPSNDHKVGFFWEMEGARERLRLVKADLLSDGSFDEAVEGVDGVFHVASPVFVPDGDIQETLIDPAIKGTVNVLKSCSKSSSVMRVVLTSSCSTIRYHKDASLNSPLNESHWTEADYCKRYNLWYAYSKTLAEREAWRLAKELNIDLVAVNPSVVVGPTVTPQPTSNLQLFLSYLKGDAPTYFNLTVGFVHIDDVVSAHMIAMEDSSASGRLICSGSVVHFSDIIDMLKSRFPSHPLPDKADDKEGDNFPHSMDTTKIKNLGLTTFKSIPQMFDDCIKSYQERGLL